MESSKRATKYYLYINFLAKKETVFPITEKLKMKNLPVSQNKNFSVTRKYHLSINFFPQKDRIFHPRKVQNKNISVISKNNLFINFLSQKNTVFLIPEKFKTRTFP